MGDAFTQQSSLASDTTAYQIQAYFQLRPLLHFDAVADVKPTNQSHRGAAVQFNIYDELTAQVTALSETADPDAIAAGDDTVTLTLVEQGALMKTTAKLRATSFLGISNDMANLVGYNAGLSLDSLAGAKLEAGINVVYSDDATARDEVDNDAGARLSANTIRQVVANLRSDNVRPSVGNYFRGFIHPDVAFDLMSTTGEAGWLQPHVYSAAENVWSGEIGALAGVSFIQTPRAPLFADAGDGAGNVGDIDVYGTIICGQQALALAHADSEGYGRYPSIVLGPKVDGLQRIQPIGWKWLGCYGIFRQQSVRRVESSSSIGDNA